VSEGIHETLTVTARSEQTASEALAETGTNTARAEITGTFDIVPTATLAIATQYIVHLPPPEHGWHIDHHSDPVEVMTALFLLALLLCALGYRVVKR
jgi:hypothetical protein